MDILISINSRLYIYIHNNVHSLVSINNVLIVFGNTTNIVGVCFSGQKSVGVAKWALLYVCQADREILDFVYVYISIYIFN